MAGVLFWGFFFRRSCARHAPGMSNPAKTYWTFAACREGAVATFPLMPGLFAFGMAFGTVAARKGFTLLDAELMSAIVFSGVAQIVVVEAWPQQLTLAAIAAAA